MNRRGCLWALGILGAIVLLLFACGLAAALGAAMSGGELRVGPGGTGAVAVIYVVGTIESGDGGGGLLGAEGAFSGTIVDQLKRARENPSVKAIVLRVDSPGGGASASDEIYNEVVKTRTRFGRPVVASMGSLAASGGYYVSAAADRILANRNTLTGSIGVISIVPNLQELLGKLGVRTYIFKSGEHKDDSQGLSPLSGEDEQIWQSLIDDAYDRFVEVVAEGRNMDQARVRQLADGRIYSAPQAKSNGLIDDYGDLEEAIELAAQLGGIQGKPRIIDYRRRGVLGGLVSAVFRPAPEISLERLTGLPRQRTLQYLHVEPY